MADIAISEDSHDTNEREGERTPSLTRVSIGSASQLEAAPEVTGGAGAPGLPQGDQTRPCVIDQQQAPQANQAAAAEATNQPQTSTSSEMPMTSRGEESQTAAPTTPTAPAAAPLVYLQRRTASAWSAQGTRAREAQDAAAATYRSQVAAWEAGKLQGGTPATPTSPSTNRPPP